MIFDMTFKGMRWQLPEVAQGAQWATTAHNMYRINSALEPLRSGAKSASLPTSDFLFAQSFFLHDDKFVAAGDRLDFATTQITGDIARRMYFVENELLQFLTYDQIPTNYPTTTILGTRSGVIAPPPQVVGSYGEPGGLVVISQIRPFADKDSTADGTIVAYDNLPEVEKGEYLETAFVYTYVNKYGEEGPPSLPSNTIYARPEHTRITITTMLSNPDTNIVGVRLYMLVNGSYFRVNTAEVTVPATASTAEIPNLTALNDTGGSPSYTAIPSFVIVFSPESALDELVSLEWERAPNGLKHLASLDNGVLAVADDNNIYLSEPYYWHAFPTINTYTVSGTIKRIANIGGGFAVMTDRGTQFFFGSAPASMVQSSVIFPYSIRDPDSFTAFEGGGVYVCDDGVAIISAAGGRIATDGWIDRESWRENVDLDQCRTEMYEGRILIATRNPANDNPIGYCLNMEVGEITSFDISVNALASGFFRDPRSNEVCYVTDAVGLTVFNRGNNQVAIWESGDIWLPRTVSLNSLYVESEGYPVTVKVTAKGMATRTLPVNSERPRRMPVTGRSKSIRVRVESGHTVGRCAVATDMRGF